MTVLIFAMTVLEPQHAILLLLNDCLATLRLYSNLLKQCFDSLKQKGVQSVAPLNILFVLFSCY